ncbi:hypothetical protein ABZ260_20380 [Streptosporangium sp. NPDC006013]|uniref:hypothetical protein n=1 Tax=Streptosporangium sp. NPDC006013 TaxID=3155596 RepID=UPI0033A0A6E4
MGIARDRWRSNVADFRYGDRAAGAGAVPGRSGDQGGTRTEEVGAVSGDLG